MQKSAYNGEPCRSGADDDDIRVKPVAHAPKKECIAGAKLDQDAVTGRTKTTVAPRQPNGGA